MGIMTVPLDKSSAKSPPPTSSSAEFTSTESLTDKVKHLTIKTSKIDPDRPHSRLSPSLSCEGSHSALDEVHHYSLTIDGPLQNPERRLHLVAPHQHDHPEKGTT